MALRDVIGRLVYNTEVDPSGVDTGMAALTGKVHAAMDELDREEAVLKLRADDKQLKKDFAEVEARRSKLESKATELKVTLGKAEYERQLKAVYTDLARLKMQRAEVRVRINYDRAALSKLRKDTDLLEKSFESLGRKILSARVNIGPFTLSMRQLIPILSLASTVITALVGTLGSLIGSLGEAVAGLTPLIAGFTGAALGATGLILAVKPLTGQLSEAGSALDALTKAQVQYGAGSKEARQATVAYQKVLQNLDPQARKTFSAFQELKGAFIERTDATRNNFFALSRDAIRTATTLLPTFTRRTNEFSRELRSGVGDWLEGLRSPEARNILDNIMGNFNRQLPTLLHGLGQFGTAIARILSEASNFLGGFVRGFDRVGTDFAEATEDGDKLHDTMRRLTSQAHSWFDLFGAAGRLMITVFTGGAREGQSMVDGLTDKFNEWNRSLRTLEGRKGLREFFADARDTSGQFLGILRRLLSFLFQVSRILEPITQGVLAVATAMADVVSVLLKFKPLRSTLIGVGAALGVIFAVNKVTQWITAARTAITTLRSLIGLQVAASATSTASIAAPTVATGAASAIAPAAGTSVARGLLASIGRALPIAGAAVGIGSILGSVIEKDSDAALKKAGGAAAGAVVGGILGTAIPIPGVGTVGGALVGGGIGSLVGGLFGGDEEEEESNRFVSNTRRASRALRGLRESQQELRRARERDKNASERIQNAEQHLIAVRRKYGRNSDEATAAERRLTRAKRAGERASDNAKEKERLVGIERKVTREELKRNIQSLHRSVGAARRERDSRAATLKQLHREKAPLRDQIVARDALREATDKVTRRQGKLNSLLKDSEQLIGKKFVKAFGGASEATKNYNKQMRALSGEADHTSKRVDKLRAAAQRLNERGSDSFTSFKDAGIRGLDKLGISTNAALRALGLDDVNFGVVGRSGRSPGLRRQYGGEVPRAQQGMSIVPGHGSGDKVDLHARVEPREGVFVMNRNAMGALAEWNSMFPRFAKGGGMKGSAPGISRFAQDIIGRFGGYWSGARPGDDGYHGQGLAADIVPGDWKGASAAVNRAGRSLLEGIYNPGVFGGSAVSWEAGQRVGPEHWGADWGGHQDHIHAALSGSVKLMAAELKRILITGPKGAMRSTAQGAVDTAWKGAKRYLNRKTRFSGEPSAGVGIGQARIASLWRQVHGRFGNSRLMSAIAMAESAGNPAAHGPPDGRGLYQIEWPVWGDSVSRFGNPYNAVANTKMAGHVLRNHSTGLGAWVAYTNGSYQQFLQKGGPLKHLKGGGFLGGGGGAGSGGREAQGRSRSPLTVGKSTFKPFSTPWNWERRQKPRFKRIDERQADLREKIDIATRKASFSSSHWGDEVSPVERKRLIRLNKTLLSSLQRERRQARRIFRGWKKELYDKDTPRANRDWIKQHLGGLRGRLEEIQGRTGRGGEIFDVKEVLAGLRGDQADAANERALQQTAFGQARYDLYRTFGGNFSPLGGVLTPPNPQTSSASLGAPSLPFTGGGSGGGATTGGGGASKTTNNTVNNYYATQPEDPHTWSRSMEFELGAMG